MAAAIANRGYYIIPHVVKAIEGIDTIEHRFYEKHLIDIDTANFSLVVEGMNMAVNGGPGRTAGIAQLQNVRFSKMDARRGAEYHLLSHLPGTESDCHCSGWQATAALAG